MWFVFVGIPLIAPYFLNNLSVYDQMISKIMATFYFGQGRLRNDVAIINNIWKDSFHMHTYLYRSISQKLKRHNSKNLDAKLFVCNSWAICSAAAVYVCGAVSKTCPWRALFPGRASPLLTIYEMVHLDIDTMEFCLP